MFENQNQPNLNQQSNALFRNSKKIFIIMLVFYILLDSSERFLNLKYDSWVYLVVFMVFFMSIVLWGIGELEKSLNSRL